MEGLNQPQQPKSLIEPPAQGVAEVEETLLGLEARNLEQIKKALALHKEKNPEVDAENPYNNPPEVRATAMVNWISSNSALAFSASEETEHPGVQLTDKQMADFQATVAKVAKTAPEGSRTVH